MRAFVISGPHNGAVREVDPPSPAPGQVVVDVHRVGVCGTDVEFFTGEMAYLHQGHARFPMRIGHEWCGQVSSVGDGVDSGWLDKRVTGDTMLGCGSCRRCLSSRQHLCETRFEIGIRGGFPGALAEQLAVPATALVELPDTVDDAAGAMVEPGGNAVRSLHGARLSPGDELLVLGPGTIGLLVALFAVADGARVTLLGRSPQSIEFAESLGFDAYPEAELPPRPFDAVIEASNSTSLPARALQLVEPGKRVVYVGLAGAPTLIDTREMALKDVTCVGVLSGSGGLARATAGYASGRIDPKPLVADVVGLDDTAEVLAGFRRPTAGLGPKVQIDPRR